MGTEGAAFGTEREHPVERRGGVTGFKKEAIGAAGPHEKRLVRRARLVARADWSAGEECHRRLYEREDVCRDGRAGAAVSFTIGM